MNRATTSLKKIYFLSAFLCLFFLVNKTAAQAVKSYKPHQVFEIGNGEKIEVLRCIEEGENILCDVIYYTTIRQQGKRKWENINHLQRLEQAEIENRKQILVANQPVNVQKSTAKKKSVLQPVNPNKVNVQKPVSAIEKKINTSVNKASVTIKTAPPEKKVEPGISIIKNSPKTDTVYAPINEPDAHPAFIDIEEKSTLLNVTPKAFPVYSLDDCFTLALDKNLQLKKAQNALRSNIVDRQTAYFSMLPSVSYNLGHYFSFGKNIDPVTNAFAFEAFSGGYTSIGLQMDLFSGFNKINTIKQTGFNIQVAEYSKKQLELELLSKVTLAYARLLFNKEQLLMTRSNIETTLNEINIINEKIKVGRLSKYEFFTFNARYNTQKVDLITYQNDSLAALQQLKQLLNIPYKQQVDVREIDSTVYIKLDAFNLSTFDFIDTIVNNHPAIKTAYMQEQVAMQGVKIARSYALPSLSLGGNIMSNYNINQINQNGTKIPLSQQLNTNLGQNINLSLRIPIFSQLETANRIKKEKINVDNARLDITETVNNIATATLQLVNDFNTSRQKYIALKIAREQNQLSYNMYQEKYRLGQISSVELVTAADILNTAASRLIQAKLDYYFRYKILQVLKNS